LFLNFIANKSGATVKRRIIDPGISNESAEINLCMINTDIFREIIVHEYHEIYIGCVS
jgi:hypothetical protein